jgi:hypothetical protein
MIALEVIFIKHGRVVWSGEYVLSIQQAISSLCDILFMISTENGIFILFLAPLHEKKFKRHQRRLFFVPNPCYKMQISHSKTIDKI